MRVDEGVAARVILNLADEPQTIRDTILKKIQQEKLVDDQSTPRQESPTISSPQRVVLIAIGLLPSRSSEPRIDDEIDGNDEHA
jgi:hypothetical protein